MRLNICPRCKHYCKLNLYDLDLMVVGFISSKLIAIKGMATMNNAFNAIVYKIVSVFVEHGVDWVITAIITYFTVRYATRQYYNKTKVIVTKNIMEQGLRALLKLNYNEELPDNAKVIFVEYKGRYYKIKKKSINERKYNFGEKIRKTVAAVGGDTMGVSPYRPRDYGVLGVANLLERVVMFNFQNGDLYKYDSGKFVKLETEEVNKTYIYKENKMELSEVGTARAIMIAIPIMSNGKLVGGLTFDMEIGAKTIYQNIDQADTEEIKTKKEQDNNKVIKEIKRTANNIVNAYFKKKGEDF